MGEYINQISALRSGMWTTSLSNFGWLQSETEIWVPLTQP